MNDYSSDYTTDKKAKIFIGNKNKVIDFKPFIENLSYEKKTKVIEFKTFFEAIAQTDGVNVSRKLTFKVVASDYDEAISNHKKFQKLLRMAMPLIDAPDGASATLKVSQIYIKFSNLISNYKPSAANSYSFDGLQKAGLLCSVSGIEYKPELDLGFFDGNGLIFAKVFTISLDLKVVAPENKKLSRKARLQAKVDGDDLSSFTPGSLFGFKTP